MRNFPFDTALSIACLGLVLGGTKLVSLGQLSELVDLSPETTVKSPLVAHRKPELPVAPILHLKTPAQTRPVVLEDNDGALDHFYQAVWRTERREPDAITRIVHYGDSPTTA